MADFPLPSQKPICRIFDMNKVMAIQPVLRKFVVMFRLKLLSASILILTALQVFSQSPKQNTNLSQVDSIAKTVKFKNSILELTNELTTPYSNDLFKARAIFIWITDNIRYDYKFYNKDKEVKLPKCKPGKNCELLFANWENKYIRRVIKRRKAVCGGYARLFKRMCDIAGIKSEIVSGYSKTKPHQVGSAGAVDHAWNVIWLDSSYYMLDPTWAAGSCSEDEETGKLIKFYKKFNDYYWLTPSADFLRNHYPKEAKWVLEPNYTKEKFACNPYYAPDIISKIKIITPESGVIKAKMGDTVHFKFEYSGLIERLQINTNTFRNPPIWSKENVKKRRWVLQLDTLALKKQQYVSYKLKDNTCEFDYVVTSDSLYYIEILFDYRMVLRFRVNIKKD